jgi:hydrogenase maturation protease
MEPRPRIIGLGSPHGDDQIGWLVARAIQEANIEADVSLLSAPVDLLNLCARESRLIVIDACRGEGRIGTTRRWKWPTDQFQPYKASNTHAIALPEVLKMAAPLGTLPEDVVIWGIEGRSFGPGNDLCTELAVAIQSIAMQILTEETLMAVSDA